MLTMTDCLDYCGLTLDEVTAVAEHEHIPEMVALELTETLCHSPDGVLRVCGMIEDSLVAAERRGDTEEVERDKIALTQFMADHDVHPTVH